MIEDTLAVIAAAAIVGGFVWLVGSIPTTEPETTTITVETKTEQTGGLSCSHFLWWTNCNTTSQYRINGQEAQKHEYERLEQGRTYECHKKIGDAIDWSTCQATNAPEEETEQI